MHVTIRVFYRGYQMGVTLASLSERHRGRAYSELNYRCASSFSVIKREFFNGEEPPSKKKRTVLDQDSVGDENILWHTNFERFNLYFRDQAIVSAVQNKVDQVGIKVMYSTTSSRKIFCNGSSVDE